MVEAGEPEAQGHSWLSSQYKASLGYMWPYIQNNMERKVQESHMQKDPFLFSLSGP